MKCEFIADWECLKGERKTLATCKFCLEARQRWITLLSPVIKMASEAMRENAELKEKVRKLEL